jgi:hypothetical protein
MAEIFGTHFECHSKITSYEKDFLAVSDVLKEVDYSDDDQSEAHNQKSAWMN